MNVFKKLALLLVCMGGLYQAGHAMSRAEKKRQAEVQHLARVHLNQLQDAREALPNRVPADRALRQINTYRASLSVNARISYNGIVGDVERDLQEALARLAPPPEVAPAVPDVRPTAPALSREDQALQGRARTDLRELQEAYDALAGNDTDRTRARAGRILAQMQRAVAALVNEDGTPNDRKRALYNDIVADVAQRLQELLNRPVPVIAHEEPAVGPEGSGDVPVIAPDVEPAGPEHVDAPTAHPATVVGIVEAAQAGQNLTGVDVNMRDDRETPLMRAAQYGNQVAVNNLLAAGADADLVDQYNQTALMIAVRDVADKFAHEHSEEERNTAVATAQAILAHTTNVDAQDTIEHFHKTALETLIDMHLFNDARIRGLVDNLLARGAHADLQDDTNEHNTALIEAIRYHAPTDLVTALIHASHNVNVTNRDMHPALYFILTLHDYSAPDQRNIIRELLDAGADVGAPAEPLNQSSSLMIAARDGGPEIFNALLEHATPVQVNAHDNDDRTALHYAIAAGSVEKVQALLNHGSNPAARSLIDGTAAEYARRLGAEHPEAPAFLQIAALFPLPVEPRVEPARPVIPGSTSSVILPSPTEASTSSMLPAGPSTPASAGTGPSTETSVILPSPAAASTSSMPPAGPSTSASAGTGPSTETSAILASPAAASTSSMPPAGSSTSASAGTVPSFAPTVVSPSVSTAIATGSALTGTPSAGLVSSAVPGTNSGARITGMVPPPMTRAETLRTYIASLQVQIAALKKEIANTQRQITSSGKGSGAKKTGVVAKLKKALTQKQRHLTDLNKRLHNAQLRLKQSGIDAKISAQKLVIKKRQGDVAAAKKAVTTATTAKKRLDAQLKGKKLTPVQKNALAKTIKNLANAKKTLTNKEKQLKAAQNTLRKLEQEKKKIK